MPEGDSINIRVLSGYSYSYAVPIVVFGVGTKAVLSAHTVERKVAQAKLSRSIITKW